MDPKNMKKDVRIEILIHFIGEKDIWDILKKDKR